MSDILQKELPNDFYKASGWFDSLVNYYGTQKQKLPVETLKPPMRVLVQSMLDVVYIYSKFPEIVYNSLGQTIDPMFYPEEYISKIYDVLVKAGKDENRPFLVQYAESLLKIRRLFEGNQAFYEEHFAAEIESTPALGHAHADKYDKFSKAVQEITKSHVNQIRRMIAERKEVVA